MAGGFVSHIKETGTNNLRRAKALIALVLFSCLVVFSLSSTIWDLSQRKHKFDAPYYVPLRMRKLFPHSTSHPGRKSPLRYKPINCGNSGHFYTEDLPNIILNNADEVCTMHCKTGFQELISLVSGRDDIKYGTCEDENPLERSVYISISAERTCSLSLI